jgi:5-methylcytosine-specific restriction enzyme A
MLRTTKSHHITPTQLTERLRGRRAVAERWRRLYAEPLCRDCLAIGRITQSSVPDHIVPLSHGGTDTDDNIRCLCLDCHRIRTNEQLGYKPIVSIGEDGWPI